MSNHLAIAAVTATLRNLIIRGLPELPNQNVTTKPPDKAHAANSSSDQINIFLYQTVPNGAWRNRDLPRQVKSGETGQPPLALNLHYLITAYGQGDDETLSHRWLGKAMSVLHDHPLLGAQEIKDAVFNTDFSGSDLENQLERVRITPQPLSVEEMSKLWTTFQTQYRVSAAYQVEVVLIESTRPAHTPLPILTRGKDDSGVGAQGDLISPFPTLTNVLPDVDPPGSQTIALLGDTLILSGHHLDGTEVAVELKHPRVPQPLQLPTIIATATTIKITIPNQPQTFPVGIYTVAAVIKRPGETFQRRTNELPLAIAPIIETNPPVSAIRNNNQVTVTLACNPSVLPEQRVALLLGSEEVLAEPHSATTSNLTFVAKDAPVGKFAPGNYFVRLRVDGVDSLLIDRTVTPPKFKSSQMVVVP
ncbi:MAG: DUF4255 domain-containing protein [Pirellulaceae bacterium]